MDSEWEDEVDDTEETGAIILFLQLAAIISVAVPKATYLTLVPLDFQDTSSSDFKCVEDWILKQRMAEMTLKKLGPQHHVVN